MRLGEAGGQDVGGVLGIKKGLGIGNKGPVGGKMSGCSSLGNDEWPHLPKSSRASGCLVAWKTS